MTRKILHFSLFAFLIGALSCGHFQGPEFSGPGELTAGGEYSPQSDFSTSDELYKSDKVLKNPERKWRRGPFQLQWPVRKVTINRGFSLDGRKAHLGLDIKGRKGDPILAAHDGIVIYAGSNFRGYGKMIILEHSPSWATLYAHLSRFKVKTGQEINAGDVIGLMGRTGHATGVHLHFELMRNKEPIDPEPALNGAPKNVASFHQNSH